MARKAIIAAGMLLLACPIPAMAQPPATATANVVDPEAVAAVRRSVAYLQRLPAFALDAEMTIDAFDQDDNPLRETHSLHYEFSAPNGLFVDWRSNGENRQLFCNGSDVSFFLPDSGAYVTLPEEGTAGDTLIAAAEQFGIVLPLPDPYLWTIGEDDPDVVETARALGRERIDGVETDHFVLRLGDLDWEIWIEPGKHPLPRRILITVRDDPDRPQFAASLRWNVAPRIGLGRFTFVPPAGARRIRDDDDDEPLARDIALGSPRGGRSARSG
ncbi:MAG TPA: DUF2092 domain-containing protein [Allosphingosinicella sp.]|jgi:hypothetical protein